MSAASGEVLERVPRRNSAVQVVPRAQVPAEPALRARLRGQFPPRQPGTDWPMTSLDREELVNRFEQLGYFTDEPKVRIRRRAAVLAFIEWLAGQPGECWQERWKAGGAERYNGPEWHGVPVAWHAARGRDSVRVRDLMQSAIQIINCADVIRPDLEWLHRRRAGFFTAAMASIRDPQGFGAIDDLIAKRKLPDKTVRDIRYRLTLILAAKGGTIADITVGDCVELSALRSARTNNVDHLLYQVLLEHATLGADAPSTLRMFGKAKGQLTIEELVDRRGIACANIRGLLVQYLRERQPALDYSSLADMAYMLGGVFWRDIELHHPGIASINLPPTVIAAWKERIQTAAKRVTDHHGNVSVVRVPRKGARGVLIKVRAFYLDIAQWAVEDPGRWAEWAVPCPIKAAECERAKDRRRHKSEMDARTRERLALLPRFVDSVARNRVAAAERLSAARMSEDGAQFAAGGTTLIRVVRPTESGTLIWARDSAHGRLRNLSREESDGFWTWAVVEVLRHTGIRIEELLELTHHSISQYVLPKTGEIVPLLSIAPSKTDKERLLLISPELADVLAAVIERVRSTGGMIPVIPSYDHHEKTWRPPMPLLFQRELFNDARPFNKSLVKRLLADALQGLGEDAVDYRAHDFRRMFITEAILNGLPPHIAQIVAGHADISTTMGYKAVYPTEAIDAHRAFLSRRRRLRPSEEYRTPTELEWEEFLGHFERRKVSVGTCGRAYGSSCAHEHACIRCPMLRPDHEHRARLAEIRENLVLRINEAQREGWAGELEGLQINLAGAESKLEQLDRRPFIPVTTNLGIPRLRTRTSLKSIRDMDFGYS